jgi:hypothetical protein
VTTCVASEKLTREDRCDGEETEAVVDCGETVTVFRTAEENEK